MEVEETEANLESGVCQVFVTMMDQYSEHLGSLAAAGAQIKVPLSKISTCKVRIATLVSDRDSH